jgi:hypothetical protein
MLPIINNPKDYITHLQPPAHKMRDENLLQVEWYLGDSSKSKKDEECIALYSAIH